MPTLIVFALILLLITPPSYGILLILLDTRTPPHQRTTRAVGGAILFKSAGVGSLMLLSLNGQQPIVYLLPLGLVALTALAIARVMQLELGSQEGL